MNKCWVGWRALPLRQQLHSHSPVLTSGRYHTPSSRCLRGIIAALKNPGGFGLIQVSALIKLSTSRTCSAYSSSSRSNRPAKSAQQQCSAFCARYGRSAKCRNASHAGRRRRHACGRPPALHRWRSTVHPVDCPVSHRVATMVWRQPWRREVSR